MYPSPRGVQQVWNHGTQRRYPKAWENQQLPEHGYNIEWERHEIACGAPRCGRSLGRYVAYRTIHPVEGIDEEIGVVEDTTREYGNPQRGSGRRGERNTPRFSLKSKDTRYAAKTTAHFRCPGCHREYARNLARLGQTLFESKPGAAYLLE